MDTRYEIIKYAKLLQPRHLVKGTSGNISVRVGKQMLITPTATPYEDMALEDVMEVDIETGAVISGNRKPSSESTMHRYLYRKRSDIGAVVHTHSTYATIFSCAHMPIPPVHYTIADIGKEVPLAPYALYGSEQLAVYAAKHLGAYNGILLANHGVVSVGESIKDAFRRADVIEEVAKLAYGSLTLNRMEPISDSDLDEAVQKFKTYIG